MKALAITITTATYEAGDNNIYLEERTLDNWEDAEKKFNELCDAMHDDIFGQADENTIDGIDEMRDERDYRISREVGTEFEYQGVIEMRWQYVEAEEPKEAWMLYETDAWLSRDSRVLFGIFTSEEKMLDAVRKLVADRPKNYQGDNDCDETLEDIQERVVDEFVSCNMQTQTYRINLYAESVNLNEYGEI